MNHINFARVDYRLIHGQVVTKWLKLSEAKSIVIIDDVLAQDEFMADIYKLSAPKGVKVAILTVDAAAKAYKEEKYQNNVFLLFKTIDSVYRSYQQGLKLEKLQIGGAPKTKDNTMVFSAVSLDGKTVEQLDCLSGEDVNISIQVVPEEPGITYQEARAIYLKQGGKVNE